MRELERAVGGLSPRSALSAYGRGQRITGAARAALALATSGAAPFLYELQPFATILVPLVLSSAAMLACIVILWLGIVRACQRIVHEGPHVLTHRTPTSTPIEITTTHGTDDETELVEITTRPQRRATEADPRPCSTTEPFRCNRSILPLRPSGGLDEVRARLGALRVVGRVLQMRTR